MDTCRQQFVLSPVAGDDRRRDLPDRQHADGGLVCTLADSVAGCAVQTTLAPRAGYTSIDIAVNYLRPVTLASGTLVATGRVIKPGRRVALSSAEITDTAGRLVATATSNCLILPPA